MVTKKKYKKSKTPRKSADDVVTESIITALEKHVQDYETKGIPIPQWTKAWEGNNQTPQSVQDILKDGTVKTKDYRGTNVILLSILSGLFGHSSPYFITFNRTKALNGRIKKGAKSYPVVYTEPVKFNRETNERLTKEQAELLPLKLIKTIWFTRYYRVFNIEDTEDLNIPTHSTEPNELIKKLKIENDLAKSIFDKMPNRPTVNMSDGDRNYYSPSTDTIVLVKPEYYLNEDGTTNWNEYWSTNFHELGHSTAHSSRLNLKNNVGHKFGNEKYAYEELRAEFTASILCNRVGIENTQENSVAYLLSWIQALKNDTKLFRTASRDAFKAVEYIDPS
tara:strand:- start:54 stop:1061 length:1008 start_codon:yes stop_codon:yes gene_type:complete